jgi:hypothetical protein
MKTATLKSGSLHVETPLGIVNITVGLTDSRGRRVDAVQVIPDRIIGDKKIIRRGYYNTRMVELKGVRA